MIFKVTPNEDECFQRLQLAYGNDAAFRVTVLRMITEFHRRRNSLVHEEHS